VVVKVLFEMIDGSFEEIVVEKAEKVVLVVVGEVVLIVLVLELVL
jgi:hypothetical protein